MTFDEALRSGIKALKKHRCSPHAGREAEELLCFSARTERETLLAHPERRLAPAVFRRFNDAINRRLRHEPVEYITGRASFFGRTFKVTKDTLIPRPATEILIENVLEAEKLKSVKAKKLVDVGTGSGAIAITLALELPDAEIVATDMSTAALRIARTNAKAHGVSGRIQFLKADLLPSKLPSLQASQLTIIANLPYIPTDAMKKLPPDICLHEPRQALDGGKDGLAYYRRLLSRCPAVPLSLFLELLPTQYAPMEKEAKKAWPGCRTKKILSGRVAIGIHIENRP